MRRIIDFNHSGRDVIAAIVFNSNIPFYDIIKRNAKELSSTKYCKHNSAGFTIILLPYTVSYVYNNIW